MGVTSANETILVSMPYWRCWETVRKAVSSVLGQSYRNLKLVVVNDGDHYCAPPWKHLETITDPRLIRFDLPENRGRYFADAVTLAANPYPFYAIHDADDWSAPKWLANLHRMLISSNLVAAFCVNRIHARGGFTYLERVRPIAPNEPLRYRMHHAGLYRTEAFREVGGPHPGYRIGYDTMAPNLLAMVGRVGLARQPLYHRLLRENSLTSHPDTGIRTPARLKVRQELEDLYDKVKLEGVSAIHSSIPRELMEDVNGEAERLRGLLEE